MRTLPHRKRVTGTSNGTALSLWGIEGVHQSLVARLGKIGQIGSLLFTLSPPLIAMARKNRRSPSVSPPPIVAQTEGEIHFLAQALDYYRAVQRAGKDAPFGQFLNYADAAVTEKGQELLRQSLENIVQTEIGEIEKKRDASRMDLEHYP